MQKLSVANKNRVKSLLIIPLLFLLAAVQSSSGIEVAKFSYKYAPENLINRTIMVDGDMVAMSEEIAVTVASNSSDTLVDTPSVFFIIDNSGSMSGTNGTDRLGNRFTVTSALLDTLQKNYPNVEVGLSVFGTTLFFDPAEKAYFVSCPGQQGGYVPLLQLNKTYAAYGNMTGYAILKDVLATRNGNLLYTPANTALNQNHTNITAGFDAARNAFLSSGNVSNHGKQYIIFLSDGEANVPGEGNRTDSIETYRFTLGTNTPTTFTVFFSTDNPPTVPATIDTMTRHIRSNGWSINNPKSAYWGFRNTTLDSLMDFLMTNVLTVITTNGKATPKSITVSGLTATNWVNGVFTFPALFPLTGTVTPFNYSITYSLYKNSVFIKDTVHAVSNLKVQIDPAVTLPADSFDVRHWDRNLNIRNSNVTISTITQTMDSLELMFDYKPGTANYNYTNIKVQVMNQLGTIRDNENFALNPATGAFSIKFKKLVSSLPIPGNRIFEVQGFAGDSLVAIFRNSEKPVLPLDTLRIAIPLDLSPLAALTSAITRDLDGDGLIDNIQISFNKKVPLGEGASSSFLIKGNGYNFPVDSILKVNDSIYLIVLKEVKTSIPQTAWTPDLSLSFVPDIQPLVNFRTTDGCPPVVWEAKKFLSNSSPTNDTLKVFLSEKITGSNGGQFNLQTPPSDVFNTWIASGTSFVPDNMFAGISSFNKIEQDSILVIVMSNSKDISTGNYVNIRNENSLIKDNAGNLPTAVNQKVRVTIGGVIFTIATGPNPARPSLAHPEQLNFIHEPNALTWVKQGQGTVIQLKNLTRPLNPEDQKKVRGVMKIIDIVGNTVTWCETPDIFTQLDASKGSTQGMNIYWNGLNQQGMIVAPGVYRVVVYVNYPSGSNIPNSKVVAKVGIRR